MEPVRAASSSGAHSVPRTKAAVGPKCINSRGFEVVRYRSVGVRYWFLDQWEASNERSCDCCGGREQCEEPRVGADRVGGGQGLDNSVARVVADLHEGRSVALGLEAPLLCPLLHRWLWSGSDESANPVGHGALVPGCLRFGGRCARDGLSCASDRGSDGAARARRGRCCRIRLRNNGSAHV